MTMFPLRTRAGIIYDSGAASMSDCHVFVDLGMTKPNSKFHSSKQRPRYRTFCSSLWSEKRDQVVKVVN